MEKRLQNGRCTKRRISELGKRGRSTGIGVFEAFSLSRIAVQEKKARTHLDLSLESLPGPFNGAFEILVNSGSGAGGGGPFRDGFLYMSMACCALVAALPPPKHDRLSLSTMARYVAGTSARILSSFSSSSSLFGGGGGGLTQFFAI